MDVRPITVDRVHLVSDSVDRDVAHGLELLARRTFVELNLDTLVRLDVRMDEAGRLHVLEANPKPDMKLPGMGRTSLVCAGLAEQDMDYDDLVLSLLADRIDRLFSLRRGMATALATLFA
jgi:D-alanine-D-alanine ligase